MNPPIAFERYDHDRCIDSAIAADARCATEGLQLTPVRRRVLGILLARHRAVGAYDILDALRAEGRRAPPPVAYRALDFLVRHGFAHRVERRNAFVACAAPGTAHAPVLLICRGCDAVAESVSDGTGEIGAASRRAGFEVERAVIEAEGLCPACQPGAPSAAGPATEALAPRASSLSRVWACAWAGGRCSTT